MSLACIICLLLTTKYLLHSLYECYLYLHIHCINKHFQHVPFAETCTCKHAYEYVCIISTVKFISSLYDEHGIKIRVKHTK